MVGTHPGYLSGTLELGVDPALNYPGRDLFLSEAGSISLEVRDQLTNVPLANVPVQLVGSTFMIAQTDGDGIINFANVPQGEYRLCAVDATDEYRNQCYPDQLLPLGDDLSATAPLSLASGESLSLAMGLVAGASISGTLTDAYTGLPIVQPNARYAFYAATGELLYNSEMATTASGDYRLAGLPELDVHLVVGGFSELITNYYWNRELYPELPCLADCQVSAGELLQTSIVAPLTDVDFSLFPGAIVRGSVVDQISGLPIEGITVQVYEPFLLGGWVALRSGVSASAGAFEIAGLRPQANMRIGALSESSYIREAWQDRPCFDSCANGDSFDLSPEQVQENLDFDLEPGFGISGRSYEFSTGAGVRASISLVKPDGELLYRLQTDADGNYQIPPIAPGTYLAYARVFGPQGQEQCQVYQVQSCGPTAGLVDLSNATPIIVTGANTVQGIDFDLISYVFVDGFE